MAVFNKSKIEELADDQKIKLLGDDYINDNIKGSSYDLRIGTIYKYEERERRKKLEKISLTEGNNQIVEVLPSEIINMLTLEVVSIPLDMCATVFPMNKKSSSGLLILNPGHIDPGFRGPISICAINLSKGSIFISLKEEIFTIVFDELNAKTIEYKNNFMDRVDYEIDFFKNRATKFSPSIFDLINLNEYTTYLRDQVYQVLIEIKNKYSKIVYAGITFIVSILSIWIPLKCSSDNNEIEGLKNQINKIEKSEEKLQKSINDYQDSLRKIKESNVNGKTIKKQ